MLFYEYATYMADENNDPPGARLRAWRRSLGYTQAQMGAVLGVDGTTLRKYEQGITLPSGSVLQQAANMGLDLNWLMNGEGLMLRCDTLNHLPPIVATHVSSLAAALFALSQIDPDKCKELAIAFSTRTEEVLRLAQLERSIGIDI